MGSERQTSLTNDARSLAAELREVIIAARNAAARSINSLQVAVNFEIGRRIVEHEQKGKQRAEYGKALLKKLAVELTSEFGKGFSETNLKLMRQFYLAYRGRIGQTASDPLLLTPKSQTSPDQSQKSGTASGKSDTAGPSLQILRTPSSKFSSPFKLSWSHYVFLMGIENDDERSFYEIEAASNGWSLRELKRQFDSGLYERLALSRDKEGVRKLAKEG